MREKFNAFTLGFEHGMAQVGEVVFAARWFLACVVLVLAATALWSR